MKVLPRLSVFFLCLLPRLVSGAITDDDSTGQATRMQPGATATEVATISPWVAQFPVLVVPEITYKTVGGRNLKLDVYRHVPAGVAKRKENLTEAAVPTLFYIHGGSYMHGTTYWELGYMLPWMELGWTVVSVEYRLAQDAKAPAAVEDCVCALHWVAQHAHEYHFDLQRLVIEGASAGGNLALLVGMAPASAGFDRDHPGAPLPHLAAIVNFAGYTDVAAKYGDKSSRLSEMVVINWIGSADRPEMARRLSPITYVRRGLPPILTVQGDSDPLVPHADALRFHAALNKAGVPNQLLTIPGGGHGGWRPEDYLRIYSTLTDFLVRNHLKDGAR